MSAVARALLFTMSAVARALLFTMSAVARALLITMSAVARIVFELSSIITLFQLDNNFFTNKFYLFFSTIKKNILPFVPHFLLFFLFMFDNFDISILPV
jgi:hypothetical protein